MDNTEILKQAEEIIGHRLYCRVPFEHLQFFSDGNVYACCPSLVDKYSFGNAFENTFDEIWNGEKANAFREAVLDGSFRFCNLKSCLTLQNIQNDSRFNFDNPEPFEKSESPKMIHFNVDDNCNAKCVMCRDKNEFKPHFVRQYEEFFDKDLIKMLKNTETIYLNGAGELFASNLCKKILKTVTSNYPNINIDLITNGILADRKNFEALGLKKIYSIEVSLHAYSKKTYDKIVRDGDYDRVMKNLKFLSEMKKQGKLTCLWLNFVVSALNYKEMIDFQKFAEKIGAKTRFWEFRPWGHAEFDNHYKEMAIFEPTHPDYEDFIKITSNPVFDSPNCDINKILRPFS